MSLKLNFHRGISCSYCKILNFHGKRFKCLLCHNYNLCSMCYEFGCANEEHNENHPMQCILTPADCELYYAGEVGPESRRIQSYVCPHCSKMGFSNATLHEHLVFEHKDASLQVICPLCATSVDRNPNFATNELARHLTEEHSCKPVQMTGTNPVTGDITLYLTKLQHFNPRQPILREEVLAGVEKKKKRRRSQCDNVEEGHSAHE